MSLSVKLEAFEGPLHLLLHLIEKNKVDIYDIPIVMITEQYLDYIKDMENTDPEIMSDFLLMAATLLDIKCRMLLPVEVTEEGEEDPRAELVQKLLEYKIYRYISFELKDMSIGAARSIYKKPSIPKEVLEYRPPVDYGILVGDMNLQKLNEIFAETLKRREDKIDPIRSKFGNIEKETIDLEGKTAYIRKYIWEHRQLSFVNLLEKQNSRLEIIVAFLVMLELMKIGHIFIRQEETFGDILIEIAEDIPEEEFFGTETDSRTI